jgi:hypothetical protein
MNILTGVLNAVLAAALALGTITHAAAADAHGHDGSAIGALKLNAGKKWQTDAPLRKGMSEIRAAIGADKAAIETGKMTPDRYSALAKKIESQVAYMIENCKLTPDADAQLHLIIADLASGSDGMKGKDGAQSADSRSTAASAQLRPRARASEMSPRRYVQQYDQ